MRLIYSFIALVVVVLVIGALLGWNSFVLLRRVYYYCVYAVLVILSTPPFRFYMRSRRFRRRYAASVNDFKLFYRRSVSAVLLFIGIEVLLFFGAHGFGFI